MKKYYLKNGSRESGPFILDDLKYQQISTNTLIKENNGEWQLISSNSNFSFLLSNAHQTDKDQYEYSNKQDSAQINKPVNHQKAILAIAVALGLVMLGLGLSLFVFFSNN